MSLELEFLGQTRLLQNCICGVPGFDMFINHKSDSRIGAVPNLVIAPSLSFEFATCLTQMFF
jgi:hypothetical protein